MAVWVNEFWQETNLSSLNETLLLTWDEIDKIDWSLNEKPYNCFQQKEHYLWWNSFGNIVHHHPDHWIPYWRRTLCAEMLKCMVKGQGSVTLNGTNETKWRDMGWDGMRWNGTDRMELGHLYWIMIKMSNSQDFIYVHMTA